MIIIETTMTWRYVVNTYFLDNNFDGTLDLLPKSESTYVRLKGSMPFVMMANPFGPCFVMVLRMALAKGLAP